MTEQTPKAFVLGFGFIHRSRFRSKSLRTYLESYKKATERDPFGAGYPAPHFMGFVYSLLNNVLPENFSIVDTEINPDFDKLFKDGYEFEGGQRTSE